VEFESKVRLAVARKRRPAERSVLRTDATAARSFVVLVECFEDEVANAILRRDIDDRRSKRKTATLTIGSPFLNSPQTSPTIT